VALVLVGALLMAGCSISQDAVGSDELRLGYIAGVNIFDPSAFVKAQQAARAEAENEVWQCMNELGFDYKIGSRYSLEANDPMAVDLLERVPDEEFVGAWGFGVGNYSGRATGDEEENTYFEQGGTTTPTTTDRSDAQDVAYQLALDGTSQDDPGCVWPAYEKFRALDQGYSDIVDDVLSLQLAFAQTSAVKDYYREWSDCMEDKGYSFGSPLEAKLYHLLPPEDIPFPEEQAAAKATVDCGGTVINSLSVDLLPEWDKYVARYWE
jgi:hypothetical protein